MASDKETVDFILDQIARAGRVSARKMFGEYVVYCDEKVVALVCDDQLFVKPSKAGREFIGDVIEGHPYPGAKPCFVISGDRWEDAEWLSVLVKITAKELPEPKKKTPRKK